MLTWAKKQEKYNELSDDDLWLLVVKRDRIAFEYLYRRYYSPLLSYALSFQYEDDMAKDCIQDLFVKLFLSDTLSPIKYVKAYLYRSFRNLLLDKQGKIPDSVGLDEAPVSGFLVDDTELANLFAKTDDDLEKSRMLKNAYDRLSENQRNAVYLYYIKEFSWDEMAASLDISTHSCMNLIARSVSKMKKVLGVEEKAIS